MQVLLVMTAALVDANGRMSLKSYTTYLTNVRHLHLLGPPVLCLSRKAGPFVPDATSSRREAA